MPEGRNDAVEDVTGAAEMDGSQLAAERRRGTAQRGIRGDGPLLGNRQLEIGKRHDSFAQERPLACVVSHTELAKATKEEWSAQR